MNLSSYSDKDKDLKREMMNSLNQSTIEEDNRTENRLYYLESKFSGHFNSS